VTVYYFYIFVKIFHNKNLIFV